MPVTAFLLLAAAAAATPCESLATLKLADATITSAVVVPEGPPPARGAGGGAPGPARGGGRAGGAAQGQTEGPATHAQTRALGPAKADPQRGARGAAPPANIPAHCRVQMILKPTSDSLINMELWLPAQ